MLDVVMGVDERPPNEFSEALRRYVRLIGDDKGESTEATALRRNLDRWSPHDPALASADLEIRRRKVFNKMGLVPVKRVRTLHNPTRGLTEYRELEGDDASWKRFRSHEAGAAYRELRATLADLQHGLCGYCEARLLDPYQVEHVVPQSGEADGQEGGT